MIVSQPQVDFLRQFQAEDGHDNAPAYQQYLRRLFRNVDLQGRNVLEIGSGRGLISLHCGVSGARQVVSLEPELDGSTSGVVETQRRRIELLGLTNVELRRTDFHEIDPAEGRFDVIVMIAVLNHLHETPINAARHAETFDAFVQVAKRLHGLLNDGGVVIATDACRYCLWTQLRRLGLPKSWCLTQRTIQWQIHQQPNVWENIFRAAGFDSCVVSHPVPYRLRKLGKLVDNRAANFSLLGEFILHAKKR